MWFEILEVLLKVEIDVRQSRTQLHLTRVLTSRLWRCNSICSTSGSGAGNIRCLGCGGGGGGIGGSGGIRVLRGL